MYIHHDCFINLGNPYLDEAEFKEMVALCAYSKYEKRHFEGGDALQDWLEAESEVSKRCFYWTQEC